MVFKSPYKDVQVPTIDSVSFIFKDVNPDSTATCLIDPVTGREVSFASLLKDINATAKGFSSLNLNKFDVVAIFSSNHMDYPATAYGALRSGLAITTLNPAYVKSEVVFQLVDSNAKAMVVHPNVLPQTLEAAAEVGIPKSKIFVFGNDDVEGVKSIHSIYDYDNELPNVQFSDDEIENKPAFLCYSSGTTGKSKGVMTSHKNMVSNMVCCIESEKNGHKDGDVYLAILPFFHLYALGFILPVSIVLQNSLVVFEKFEPILFLKSLQVHKVTAAHLVPPIINLLIKHPICKTFDLSSLREVLSAAAPLGPESAAAFRTAWPTIRIRQGYGMSELSPVSHICPPNEVARDGSVGVVVVNHLARLVDGEGNDVVVIGGEGELWIKGPNVMLGYLNNEEATRLTVTEDGWLKTGDLAKVDEYGHFYIVDRLKELIKYNGFQVAPAELESLLLTHPKIAVVPKEDERAGELPVAFVVLKTGEECTEEGIVLFMEGKTAPHKKLRGGVIFCKEIPKSASGKILRRILRDKLKQ